MMKAVFRKFFKRSSRDKVAVADSNNEQEVNNINNNNSKNATGSPSRRVKCNLQLQNSPQLPMSPTPPLHSPVQRDHLSLSLMNPRTRRFSCSSNSNGTNSGLVSPGPRLAPRISQLRQEECVDVHNREATHEREVHSALSISQSYEDLTLVMSENWTFRNSDEFSNPLHVSLSTNSNACSSPSPTNRHNVVRLQYGMSPSPTRRSFATRRSMSPIAIRPSPLGSVKRKFDMIDDGNSCSSSTSSSQPYKKIFSESRGSSPIMSPFPICPSPDSSTNNSSETGRSTPKMFITKAFSSMTSSPLSTISLENDSPSPSSSVTALSSMDVGSTSGDSGVDANSDVGSSSELASDASIDLVARDEGKVDEMDVLEPEPSTASIPMTRAVEHL